jgi:hypothetical protein
MGLILLAALFAGGKSGGGSGPSWLPNLVCGTGEASGVYDSSKILSIGPICFMLPLLQIMIVYTFSREQIPDFGSWLQQMLWAEADIHQHSFLRNRIKAFKAVHTKFHQSDGFGIDCGIGAVRTAAPF